MRGAIESGRETYPARPSGRGPSGRRNTTAINPMIGTAAPRMNHPSSPSPDQPFLWAITAVARPQIGRINDSTIRLSGAIPRTITHVRKTPSAPTTSRARGRIHIYGEYRAPIRVQARNCLAGCQLRSLGVARRQPFRDEDCWWGAPAPVGVSWTRHGPAAVIAGSSRKWLPHAARPCPVEIVRRCFHL